MKSKFHDIAMVGPNPRIWRKKIPDFGSRRGGLSRKFWYFGSILGEFVSTFRDFINFPCLFGSTFDVFFYVLWSFG